MARTAPDGLSRHPTKGYRLTIGKKPNGKPRLFWLGHHRWTAECHANTLRSRFETMRKQSRSVWTDGDLEGVKWVVGYLKRSADSAWAEYAVKARYAEAFPESGITEDELAEDAETLRYTYGDDSQPAAIIAPPSAYRDERGEQHAESKQITLYGAIDAFLTSFNGKRRSVRHKERIAQVLNVNLKDARGDCPLSEIDYRWLDAVADHFKARPAGRRTGRPMSPSTVRGILTYLRIFFTWIDDAELAGWQLPRRGLRCFRVRVADLMTPAEERASGTIRQFDVETLRRLYWAASSQMKSIMLAALFCGFTQQELAVLRRDEVDLDRCEIDHVRNKTKVRGKFWIPPELVTLLRAEFAARPGDELVWRTADGNALVTRAATRQASDAVAQAWTDLRVKARVPQALSFKYLRKYLADWMAKHGGEEMAQVALAHSSQTVLAKSYSKSRPFERLVELQQAMHAELAKAGFWTPD